MMNHNPYNIPEKPPSRNRRLQGESGSSPYHRSDSIGHTPSYMQYSPRQPLGLLSSHNNGMKKSPLNAQQIDIPFGAPVYDAVRGDSLRFLPSPKSQQTSSATNLTTLGSSNSQRGSYTISSSVQNKEPNNIFRDGLGITSGEFKDIQVQIERLSHSVRNNQVRINDLEKAQNTPTLSTNSSAVSSIQEECCNKYGNSVDLFSTKLAKFEDEWHDNFKKIRNDIIHVKQEINFGVKNYEIDKLLNDKVSQFVDIQKSMDEILRATKGSEEITYLREEVGKMRSIIDERVKKTNEPLMSQIRKLEKEIQELQKINHTLVNSPKTPPFRPSNKKFFGSPTLLNYIQGFKVTSKTQEKGPRRSLTTRESHYEVTITDNTYYIDPEGYLLDSQQQYLVDSRGNQIQLEKAHLQKLREQNIIL